MIKTSPKKTSSNLVFTRPDLSKRPKEAGYTLIEMMIVLAILGLLVTFGVRRMNFKNGNMKSAVRELTVLTRQIRNEARIKQRTYRLVFEMTEKSGSYWIESADAGALALSKTAEDAAQNGSDGVGHSQPQFQKDTHILKKEKVLPTEVFFGSVETQHDDDPVTSGKAYIYFTADGLVEKSVIQITNRKRATWSLIVNPLTGHADIMEKAVRLKDVSQED